MEKGIVKSLFYDRYWAKKQNKPFSPTNPNQSLVMDGGVLTSMVYTATGPEGLLPKGKKVVVVSSRGGFYGPGTPAAAAIASASK